MAIPESVVPIYKSEDPPTWVDPGGFRDPHIIGLGTFSGPVVSAESPATRRTATSL